MKRDISDIKKELSKMCNDIGESSTDIKTHIEKIITESAKELQSQCSGQKDSFANIVKKCQMPNLDSINENVKKVLVNLALIPKTKKKETGLLWSTMC